MPADLDAIMDTNDPFVRFDDIDNRSYQDIQGMGLTPPFHPRCRCTVVLLERSFETGAAVPESPPVPPELRGGLADRAIHRMYFEEFAKNVAERNLMRAEIEALAAQGPISPMRKLHLQMIDYLDAGGVYPLPAEIKPPVIRVTRPTPKKVPPWLRSEDIIDVGDLGGGVNESFIVTTLEGQTGQSKKFVWKPDAKAKANLRPGIEAETYSTREELAYKVDSMAGGNMVPPTVKRGVTAQNNLPDDFDFESFNWYGKQGSAQEFIGDAKAAFLAEDEIFDVSMAARQKLGIFDIVTNGADRHNGNWLLKGYDLVAIDNGLSFGSKKAVTDSFVWIADKKFSQLKTETMQYVENMIRERDTIVKMVETALSKKEAAVVTERLNILEWWKEQWGEAIPKSWLHGGME